MSGGIDLDAPTSVEGSFGQAAVALLVLDSSLPESEQRTDLARNVSVICAGAASDARILSIDPEGALIAQPGDRSVAIKHAADSVIVSSEEEAIIVVTKVGLPVAVRDVGRPEVWAAIERLATAVLEAGGRLDRVQIEQLGRIM